MLFRRASFVALALRACASVGAAPAGPSRPVSVYVSWAAHDELSDTVRLDESLAFRELSAISALKKQGAEFDYFLLDMGWFDRDFGYRRFRREDWPQGPDRFLAACREHGLKPGLWLSTNVCGWSNPPWMTPLPEWKDSRGGYLDLAMSLHTGGYLAYQIETMQRWYDRGVRAFKFDFAVMGAASPAELARLGRAEVERLNADAWWSALRAFRERNPEVLLMAYNGYGGDTSDTSPRFSLTVNPRWLDVFDSLYCGDPKPSDVPCANFWRSLDTYSDAMVFQYQANGIPLPRVDSSGFMIGNTGTIYRRGKAAWKGTMILSAARGGHVNTYYGDVALLDAADGDWFARVQGLYFPFQERGQITTFGDYPGSGRPYGFVARGAEGAVYTVVNPGTAEADEILPPPVGTKTRLLFTDSGSAPIVGNSSLHLGPGQMAVVGTGGYAEEKWDLGTQKDVAIPSSCEALETRDLIRGPRSASATVNVPRGKALRIACRQLGTDGRPWRVSGGAPPSGVPMGRILVLEAEQDGHELTMTRPYDLQIWSGLSWAVAEAPGSELAPGRPIRISYEIRDPKGGSGTVELSAFAITD